jgi:transcriptional regulator GlxA family with amidase domain
MRKNIAILVFDEVEILDFAGPFEVFSVTDELRDHAAFHTFTITTVPGTVRGRNGLKIVPDFTLESTPAPDVVVVPGGQGTRALLQSGSLLEWLRTRAHRAEITLSVCTGSLVLAKAGLLDGLRTTTHHQCLEQLRELAPLSTIDPSRRYHDNGSIVTAAGISAGIDASLHVVSRLLGQQAAQATAEYMEYLGHWQTP